ncbi:CBS domain-containing protein [Sphingomonas sp.]|uniref:CBS domain-containing protein n=1 Tax=Sphingomonas sp. TaxID=28214 RepID=UPI003AFF906E
MTIAAILKSKGARVVGVPPTATVREVVAMLAAERIGAVPVLDDHGAVVGIFSERDVIGCIHARGAAALNGPVAEAMTAPAITVAPDQPVIAALSLMTRRRIRHLPVVADGALVGFISIGDLVKYRIDRIEADADAMRAYIQSA